jgi:hypothetical protein
MHQHTNLTHEKLDTWKKGQRKRKSKKEKRIKQAPGCDEPGKAEL